MDEKVDIKENNLFWMRSRLLIKSSLSDYITIKRSQNIKIIKDFLMKRLKRLLIFVKLIV